jgi:hypothetical protein
LLGKFSVGHRGSAFDLSQGTPDLALEWCAGSFYRQRVDGREVSGKVVVDCTRQVVGTGSRFKTESILSVVKPQEAAHSILVFFPIDSAEVSVVVRHEKHLADGRRDSIH